MKFIKLLILCGLVVILMSNNINSEITNDLEDDDDIEVESNQQVKMEVKSIFFKVK